jgi:SP family sugar:H+ symporter-like MFS transporter
LISAKYAALDSKVGFIFGSIATLGFVFVWFCVPECKGKTLEQIDVLFQSGTRIRDFGNARFDLDADSDTVRKGINVSMKV